MRPPQCAVCKNKFIREIKKGGLVHFNLSPSDKSFNERFKKPGFVGHPRGKVWFCKDHIVDAKALSHLEAKTAIAQLKIKYGFAASKVKKAGHLYRDRGAVGALLDEYERAIIDLRKLIKHISDKELSTIVDTETKDEDCRSIQTILSHVVRSGYGYAIYLRNQQGEHLEMRKNILLSSTAEYNLSLKKMFAYNLKFFAQYPNIKLEEKEEAKKILTNWGQRFDPEQLLEHAIVHILRHRRQIERFLLKLRQAV